MDLADLVHTRVSTEVITTLKRAMDCCSASGFFSNQGLNLSSENYPFLQVACRRGLTFLSYWEKCQMMATTTSENANMDACMARYLALARKCKREQRMLMNHVCVRVADFEQAEDLLERSFGLSGFVRPGGDLFEGEKELSVLWINDEFYLELMQPQDP